MDDKYKGLRIIGKIAIILAWIFLIGSIIAALLALFGIKDPIFRWVGFFGLPFGISSFFWLYIVGKLLYVVTDIEDNTRGSSTAVGNLVKSVQDQQAAVSKRFDQVIQEQSATNRSLEGAIAQLTDSLTELQASLAAPPEPEPEVEEAAPAEEEPEAPAEAEESAEAEEPEAPAAAEEPAEAEEEPAAEEEAADTQS